MNYEDKLNKINDGAIWNKAFKLASSHGLDQDDAHQEILVRLMELAIDRPEIYEQSGAYVLQRAYWDMCKKHGRSNEARYERNRVQIDRLQNQAGGDIGSLSDEEVIDGHAFRGNGGRVSFTMADLTSVREIMAQLDGRLLECATLLYRGYSRSEVAAELGVSKVSVHKYVQKLRAAFAG